MSITSYQEAKNKFLSYDVASAEEFFELNHFRLESGYCKLLSGKLEDALAIFKSLSDEDLRANWAVKLIGFINGRIVDLPSYFQIRNFLEIDLNLLIEAKKPEYIDNILGAADYLYEINPESYKFIARAMIYNNFHDVAFHYLKKAKEKFYYDPELHLMLANCYLKNNEKFLAKQSINNCLRILPNYFPARKLLETIH